ncbi:MAG: hypothetical protein JHC26_09020 [Thermofilum sp.]|jgi:hypothetical protein|uniref:hypothetical protein n=1 Tax=Thermofilum sp. TaxID=1961369 RepID=UPI0025881896|nr:hypothetical protein [Thermofilum sp.]MCI4409220.1 hypothetical protein [Thermofilum sp.]
MAENIRYKYVSSGSSVTIPARVGYRHRILELYIDSPANNSYFDVYVGSRIVGRFPVKWGDSLFVAPNNSSLNNQSLFGFIRSLFGNDYYIEGDASEDITFNFSNSQSGIHIYYQEDTDTVDKTKPLRSLSPSRVLFHILTHSKTISASGNYSLDTPIIPTGFLSIADGSVFPSNTQWVVKALAFGSAQNGSTTPTALHIWRDNYEYFTPYDHTGVSVKYGQNFLVFDITRGDFFDIPDVTFQAGNKISVNIDATYDSTNSISAGTLALIIIGEQKPMT